jgi:hypothetical protein
MPVVIGLALLAFWLYCLFDVITTPEESIRNLPKMLWVLIVVLLVAPGGLLWFLLGRPVQQEAHTPRRPGMRPRPGPGFGPPGNRHAPPLGPDDDPEFLRNLDRRLRDDD